MKAKKVLGLALSAMMAISAVVPWTGLTASAEESVSVMTEYDEPQKGSNIGSFTATVTIVTKDGTTVETKDVKSSQLEVKKNAFWEDGDYGIFKSSATVTLKNPSSYTPDEYEFVNCDSSKTVSLRWNPNGWKPGYWEVNGKVNFTVVVKEKEPENVEVTVKYVDENQNPIEGYESKTFTVKADELESWKANEEFVIDIPGYTYQKVAIDFGTSLTVKYQKNETPVEPEIWWYNVRFYLNGESKGSQAFTVETSTDTAVVDIASLPAFTDEFEGATYDHDASSADNAIKNDDGTFTISGSDTATIYAYFTKDEPVDPETKDITVKYVDENGDAIIGSVTWTVPADTNVGDWAYDHVVSDNMIFFDDYTYKGFDIDGNTVILKYESKDAPVDPETKDITVKYVDENGNTIIGSVTWTVPADTNVGDWAYDHVVSDNMIFFDDYTYKGFDIDGNTVILNYESKDAPVDPETKDITVKYVDENGNTIIGSVTWTVPADTDVGDWAYDHVVSDNMIFFDDYTYKGFDIDGNTVILNYESKDAPAQDMTLNMTYADIDSDKVLGHGAAVISSDTDLTAWINEQYTGNIITYDGVQYVYTGVYASTANDTTINATLYYREVEVAEENREIQLTFVDADDQTKVLGHGAGVVPAGETSEAWIYNVYNGDVIEYAGAKYVYTGSNTIVENEDGITATLLYRKAEVVEKDREIQLTFVDIDSNKTLGHGAGVVPAGEASEAWIYNVYNGDVITFENEKYTYTGANTIVENETSITATLYYKKAEVVGEDKEIQLTFVDADDQTKVLGHGAGVVLAGQTVEEWLNEVYPIGDVIEYAGAKYAYTGASAIVEGEDSFTATLLYRKTEALEKDKEIQLIFVDADNQTKVLGRGAGVVLAGQSIEEWLDEVYPIGDVITYKNEKYVYTGSKSVVEGEDSITATLLYRKDTDPTDPDEPDDPDPDRPSSGGGYFPSRPDDEEIDDPTTPEASNPGDGSGSAGPGGAGDGAVPVEDPGEELGDGNVPLVEAPQTGRKIAGSIALLAGAAVVAVVTLKKRKDK